MVVFAGNASASPLAQNETVNSSEIVANDAVVMSMIGFPAKLALYPLFVKSDWSVDAVPSI